MDDLVIGKGEIGTAIQAIFECEAIGRNEGPSQVAYKYLHICFPYSEEFIDQVRQYKDRYFAQHVIIHSTVPPGTSRKLNATHSPVLGIHPHLEEGIRTFTKFLGGPEASIVANHFRKHGLRVYIFDKPETTELMKILDTTFYGMCIEYVKDVKKLSEKWEVPFEAWTLWTNNYNEGYVKLNHPEYVRPNLVPIMTNIQGHCVIPNTDLLETKFTKFLKENNQ